MSVDQELQARISAFAADLAQVLRQAVAQAVGEVLTSKGAAGGPKRRGRPPGSKNKKGSAKKASAKSGGRGIGSDALLRELKRKPERRMEEIAKSLRTTTSSLITPMKQLLEDKKAKKTGQARGTKYSAK